MDKDKQRDRDSEIVGQITGGVLHDFNNVLQSIIGLAEMLDADPSIPQRAKISMKAIRRLGENAAKMVRSLSDTGEKSAHSDLDGDERSDVVTSTRQVKVKIKKKLSILIAEDDHLVLNAITGMLRHLGYSTIGARNGKEALRLFMHDPDGIGLVITDMVMPEMDGLELAKTLLDEYPDTRIVVMTGYLQEEIDIDLEKHGLVGWLEKPMSAQRLSEVIDEHMLDE